MKQFFILLSIVIPTLSSLSQQLHSSSFYDIQGVMHNSAMAGVQPENFVGLTFKTQWRSVQGSPQTGTAFGSFNIPSHEIGIAGTMYHDVTGATSRSGISFSLAKHIVLYDESIISIGLENRIQQYAINKDKLQQILGNDPAILGAANKVTYDAGIGFAYSSDRLILGASVSQLVQSKLDFYSGNLTRTERAKLYRHYYINGSYEANSNDVTTITPNFLYIYLPNAPADFQIGARVVHNKKLWWGLGYRFKQSFIAQAGLNINEKLTIGYSYDDYLTPVSRFDGGSVGHEFLLKYTFIRE